MNAWVTDLAIVFLVASVCAVLRRIDGGWLGLSKSVCVAMLVTVMSSVAIVSHPGWDVWLTIGHVHVYEWVRQTLVVLSALWYLQGGLVPSRDFSSPVTLLWYSNGPAVIAALYGFWPALLVGPFVALCAYLAKRYGGAVATPFDRPGQIPIDSWEAWYEIMGVGFCGGAALSAAPLLGAWQ